MSTPSLWRLILESPRLILRPLVPEDFDALFAAASDPLLWAQHPDRERYRRERFERFFQSGLAAEGAFVIIDRSSGRVIGSSRFVDHDVANSSIEIGYTFLTRDHWGTGLNRELKTLMLDHAFGIVETVYFFAGEGNLRSQRALAKIGATEVRREVDMYGPTVVFRLTRQAWQAR